MKSREVEEQSLRQQSAGLRAKVEALNEEVRALNGRIEELEHLLNRQKQVKAEGAEGQAQQMEQLTKSAKNNEVRIYRIEQYLNFETTAAKTPAAKPTEKTTTKIIPAGQTKAKQPQRTRFGNGPKLPLDPNVVDGDCFTAAIVLGYDNQCERVSIAHAIDKILERSTESAAATVRQGAPAGTTSSVT